MDMDPSHLSYQTYYDLLINACVRYDKTKKANIGKRRNVYNSNIDTTYVDDPPDVFEFVPDSPNGGIDLPPDEFMPFPLGIHIKVMIPNRKKISIIHKWPNFLFDPEQLFEGQQV